MAYLIQYKQLFPGGERPKVLLAILFVLVLSGIARSWVAYPEVFKADGSVRLLGVDATYHLRQSKHILDNFPYIARWDNQASFPRIKKNGGTGLMNVLIASISKVVFGLDASLNDIALIAVVSTFVIGSLCTLILYLLSGQFLNRRYSILCVFIFLIFPGEFLDKSLLGFADQHVAEVFLLLLSLFALCKYLHVFEKYDTRQIITYAFLSSLPFVLLSYTWRGAAIYLPLIAISLVIYITLTIYSGKPVDKLKKVITAYALSTTVMYLTVHVLTPWLEMSPKGTRWLIFGSAGLGISAWLYLTIVGYFDRVNNKRLAVNGLVGIVCSVIILLLFTSQGQAIWSIYFSQRNELITEQTVVNFSEWLQKFGIAGILSILASLVLLPLISAKKISPLILLPFITGILIHLIWLATGDFGYLVAPFVALHTSTACFYISSQKKYSKFALLSIAILAMLMFYPLKLTQKPWLNIDQLHTVKIYSSGWYNAVSWLGKHTPDIKWKEKKPDHAVIASWEFGNLIAAYGKKVPVWSRYPSTNIHHWLTSQSEQEAQTWLCKRCKNGQKVRYAIVDAKSYGDFFAGKARMADRNLQLIKSGDINIEGGTLPYLTFNNVYTQSMVSRLYKYDGQQLQHYRLIYETPEQHLVASRLTRVGEDFELNRFSLPKQEDNSKYNYRQFLDKKVVRIDNSYIYDGEILPTVKIFEIVKGARIAGAAPGGSIIKVELTLFSSTTNREFTYQQVAIANDQNTYELRVPYPTINQSDNYTVTAKSSYRLSVNLPESEEFVAYSQFDVEENKIY